MPHAKDKTYLQERTNRVRERLAREQKKVAALQTVDALDLRGRLRSWVERAQQANAKFLEDADQNDDGEVDFDELVDAVVAWADDSLDLTGVYELVTDFGLDIVGSVAVAIYKNREHRLARRVERDTALLAQLERRLAAVS